MSRGKAVTCCLSLENMGCVLFHGDAHEVEGNVPELKKGLEQITLQDRDVPSHPPLVLKVITEMDEAQMTKFPFHQVHFNILS